MKKTTICEIYSDPIVAGNMAAADHHHVHFEAADVVSHDNSMIIKQPEEGKIDIHVGFLQVLHKYEIVAKVPSAFLPNADKIVPSPDTKLSNLFVR